METRLILLLRSPVHRLEGVADGIEMQEFKVVQAIVQLIILVEVTADKVGKMDKARVNEGRGGVTEDDRLEFRNRIKGGELNQVGNKLEPTERKSVTSQPSLQTWTNTDNSKPSVSGLMFWSENILGLVLFAR